MKESENERGGTSDKDERRGRGVDVFSKALSADTEKRTGEAGAGMTGEAMIGDTFVIEGVDTGVGGLIV